jgi:hypothetical protein
MNKKIITHNKNNIPEKAKKIKEIIQKEYEL